MNVALLFPLLGVVAAIWFWLRASRTALHLLGNRRAERAGLGLTVATVLAGMLAIVLDGSSLLYQVGWLVWAAFFTVWFVVIVTFYPLYGPLLRVTGGGDTRAALRDQLWELGDALGNIAIGATDPSWSRRAEVALAWLDALRTPDTSHMIDLWLAEAAAVQARGSDGSAAVRHTAIRAEAHRLWPHGDDWRFAAILID